MIVLNRHLRQYGTERIQFYIIIRHENCGCLLVALHGAHGF